MIAYQVVIVDDKELPDSHDWALVELSDRVVFIARESAGASAYAEGWAAYRMLGERRRFPLTRCRTVRPGHLLAVS